jgi:hypothetical protein
MSLTAKDAKGAKDENFERMPTRRGRAMSWWFPCRCGAGNALSIRLNLNAHWYHAWKSWLFHGWLFRGWF